MRNLYKTKLFIPCMNSKRVGIAAVVAVIIVLAVYCGYASQHAFDVEGEPESFTIDLEFGDTTIPTTLETYMSGDPARLIQYTLINPNVDRVYILFKASESGTDTQHLVKASASLGEALGAAIGKGDLDIDPKDVIPREIGWVQKVLIYSGFMGTESKPVIYLKTPNVEGLKDRITVRKGIIIIESSTYENSYFLASYVRQLVML